MATTRRAGHPGIAAAPALARGQRHPVLTDVQTFLERYGYLVTGAAEPDLLDGPTSAALRAYQEFRGMDPSGELDPATRDQMAGPRCGNPDLGGGLPFKLHCPLHRLDPIFQFVKGTTDVPDVDAFGALRRAFATWAATGHFCFGEVGAGAPANFRLGWVDAHDPDFDLPAWAAAHADTPCNRDLPFQHVHFNDEDVNWGLFDYFPFRADIETVALHEIGHLLGLDHSMVREAVMWPDYPRTERRVLHADDIAGLDALYGHPPARLATSIVFETRQHFGDEPNHLPGEFVGQVKEFRFACPRVDVTRPGVLLFQANDVSNERNQLAINGHALAGDVPRTAGGAAWAGQVLLIRPGVLRPAGNILKIESRNSSGTTSGDIDDFVIDNVIVLYETLACHQTGF